LPKGRSLKAGVKSAEGGAEGGAYGGSTCMLWLLNIVLAMICYVFLHGLFIG
jgi:hypothetical protein